MSRFQTLIQTHLAQEGPGLPIKSPSFYAQQLHIHPNHLNAIVKRISGKTATALIQEQLITLAKSLLRQAQLSTKEVAYQLQYKNPTHFIAFFKKMTGVTPSQYQQQQIR